LLKNKYPDINIVEVESAQEGLVFVEQDRNFAYLDNTMVINNEIQKNNMNFISISGQFSESFNLSIASRNDEAILNEILQKALLSIDDKHKLEFSQKWNNINYQTKINNQLIIQILFFTIVFISIFIYWNLRLKEEIKSKESAQNQLKESEEKFRTLFDIAPILLNAFNKEGKIVLWNKECEKVFGWTLEEIIKEERPIDLFYPDPLIQEKVIQTFADDSQNFYQDWYPLTKEGKRIITRWANIKLPNNEVINIGYDITQQREDEIIIEEKNKQIYVAKELLEELNSTLEKRIEEEISKNTKQQIMLMHQSKLVQMGEMIENIAHQWRQPLAQINSSVLLIDMILNKNKFIDNTVENKLEEIESITTYMSKTIDDFKNFFDPNKQKNRFKIKNAIEKSFDILKGLTKLHHIKVIIDIEKDLECDGYLEELQQVILIILNNAIDALIINKISSPKITFKAYTKETDIIISIEDNALGIKDKHLNMIFEPYFTTKLKTQGTGIGLYMAKMIIESGLEGNLSVKNTLNGSCFTIQIPKGEKL
nr:PAS domain S-box protein [Aliarcobacter sp.]